MKIEFRAIRKVPGVYFNLAEGSVSQANGMGIDLRLVMEAPSTFEATRMEPPKFTWVSDAAGFRAMIEVLKPVRRMALDIEADSLYHYFEKVCLIQISTDCETFVLDPLAMSDLSALQPMMENPKIEKVFHAAGYDIFCLHRDYGFSFTNVFDTYIAGQLVGYEFLGLSALMEKLLGIVHSKRRQRDDWSQRPLKAEQLEYAAMDTHYLLRLRDVLEQQLQERGRCSWAAEEFEAMATSESTGREFNPEDYRRIKGSRNLTPHELAALRALFLLREDYARQLDVPPFKVLNNPVLLDLARKAPSSPRELLRRSGVSYRIARRFGREICSTIRKAQAEGAPPATTQPNRNWKPPSPEIRQRLGNLRHWRSLKATELSLPVGVVFPGNLLECLAISPPHDLAALANLDGMRRWRVQEFGQEILRVVQIP